RGRHGPPADDDSPRARRLRNRAPAGSGAAARGGAPERNLVRALSRRAGPRSPSLRACLSHARGPHRAGAAARAIAALRRRARGPPSRARRGAAMRRLPTGSYLLGYLLLVTAVITLAPFRFARPIEAHVSWLVDPGDRVANVLLFLPLGFLFRMATRASAGTGHWPTLGAALLVSGALETLQLFRSEENTSALQSHS